MSWSLYFLIAHERIFNPSNDYSMKLLIADKKPNEREAKHNVVK